MTGCGIEELETAGWWSGWRLDDARRSNALAAFETSPVRNYCFGFGPRAGPRGVDPAVL